MNESNNTHPMQQAATLRLLAAALELQHLTSLAANVVPIPGGERVIAIGTADQVRRLLPRAELAPELKAALEEAAKTRATGAVLPDGSAVFINYGDQPEDTAHLNCTACGGSGHIDDQLAQQTTLPEDVAALFGACGFEIRSTDPAEKHPLAVCGSLDAAGLVVETVLTQLDQGDPEAIPAEFVALLPGVTYMDPPDGGSVSLLEQFRRMAHDAEHYRRLRDAEKIPGFVWAALEAGEGVDKAMETFKAITTPIPFCEPCKAGRFSECEQVFPCTLPALMPANVTDSEGGHHD